ncbi:MAG: hydrogenase nickel incorporation protein HypB [Cyanothece sp. SIO1E1]|nr:hydrogenase nickel incorporation protein HypB [Cyanothece sp. SIO1E1]
MCKDCGCDQVGAVAIDGMQDPRLKPSLPLRSPMLLHLDVREAILAKNTALAERNRDNFTAQGVLVLNVLSSPGSGKTALIERMLKDSGDRVLRGWNTPLQTGVIVGDLATDHDAQRLRHTGAPTIQITTGNACHLEANMVAKAVAKLDLETLDLLVIENVGNLVCPAIYDLGEALRVVLLAVTEGEDKPLRG